MGVSGLLPLLKSIQKPAELRNFAGKTIGVDAYGWLHRGAISCATELAQGKPTRKYVDFAMHRVRMLTHFGVTPYLVFDGDYLPSKAMTEGSREKRRDDSKKLGMELLKAGKPTQAYSEFQKAIDVTPEMARNLIDELKEIHVSYVVAPYEADAQLVYLERQGIIDAILSEDSDLLVFGCQRLLTKLDQYGNCTEVKRKDFCAVREVSLTGWTDADFRHMAILSGCDYLAGINNMGLKTAYRMIRKHKTPERLVRMLQFEGKHRVSEDYLFQFTNANLTFLYQRVFCPDRKEMVCLTDPPKDVDVDTMPFVGAFVERDVARAVASGDVNPMTKLPIVPAPMPESRSRRAQQLPQAPARTETRTFAQAIQRAATVQAAPNGKPIDSYFRKNGRVPLGNMDANCFSVAPNQRRATRNDQEPAPRVWPLPRPYVPAEDTASSRPRPAPRRRTEDLGHMLSRFTEPTSSSASRRQTAGMPSSAANPTESNAAIGQRPPKKARLCADHIASTEAVPTAQKSKYFSATNDIEKNNPAHEARREKDDLFLPSDDSIDEAMLNLPDFDGFAKPSPTRRTFTVYEESQNNKTTDTNGEQQPAQAGEAAAVSATPLRSTLQQFTFTADRSSSPSQTPASAESEAYSSVFTPSTGAPSTVASSIAASGVPSVTGATTHGMTPLQRLGARALGSKKSPSVRMPTKKLSPRKRGFRESLDAMPVNPSFVPLPRVNLDEVEALNQPVGSEDHIVPDSDEENEVEDNGKLAELEGTENLRPSRLDLSRFTYH